MSARTAGKPLADLAGYSCKYLEKQSMKNIMYVFPSSSGGKGPIVSIATRSMIEYVAVVNGWV
jgi:hypothetical protein